MPESVPEVPAGSLLPLTPDEWISPQLLPGQYVDVWVVQVCTAAPVPRPGWVWVRGHDSSRDCECGQPWCLELMVSVDALRRRTERTGQ